MQKDVLDLRFDQFGETQILAMATLLDQHYEKYQLN